MKPVNDKTRLSDRSAALRRFNKWEARHPIEMRVNDALAGVGTLYELMPIESRKRVVDPRGLCKMREALSHLKGRS